MSTVERVLFSVVDVTTYSSLLRTAGGHVTRKGHSDRFEQMDTLGLSFPWNDPAERDHHSLFWLRYLGSEGRLDKTKSDTAFDRVVPFARTRRFAISGPAGTDAAAAVLVYPAAVAVVIRVTAFGKWALAEAAKAVQSLASGRDWTLTLGEVSSANRNLDGIAKDLRAVGLELLSTDDPTGESARYTVAAVGTATGEPNSFDLSDSTAAGCAAGLAVLGPPGRLVPERLLEANSSSLIGGRTYALGKGHTIWHPDAFLEPYDEEDDPIGCLHRNHSELVAQVAALSGMAQWAGDLVGEGINISPQTKDLMNCVVLRLRQLYAGDARKTYKCGVAKQRIEPLVATLAEVEKRV